MILFQSVASAGTASGLKTLIDDYRYSLTVEWDQKDEAALKLIQSNFRQELQRLNVSATELKEVLAQSESQDAELLSILNMKDEAVMAEELQKLVDVRSETMYARGTSWSPLGVFWSGVGILLVAEIIVLILDHSNDCENDLYYTYPEGVRYACQWPAN
jgi:hypothetical protein